MPFTTTVGGVIYVLMLGCVGLEDEAFSNVNIYLLIFNTLLAHAHDTRCAHLPYKEIINNSPYIQYAPCTRTRHKVCTAHGTSPRLLLIISLYGRCARLMAPLPDGLNFVAYHYVHHLSPSHNYGLTEPSDMFWDKMLGVNTIKKLEEFDLKKD